MGNLLVGLLLLAVAYVVLGLAYIDGRGHRFRIPYWWSFLLPNRPPDYPGRRYDLVHWHVWRWKLKQLLPLAYWTTYEAETSPGVFDRRELTIWRMWLGRSFNVTRVQVL